MNKLDDLTKLSMEDLDFYYNTFKNLNRNKFAERIQKEKERRKREKGEIKNGRITK